MATAEEHLVEWLRDAHAMEQQAETMLSSFAGRVENYPDLKSRIERHLEETRQQVQIIRRCIVRRGGDTSTIKDLAAKFVAMTQGFGGVFAGDEVIKGSMASYSFEEVEIASYTVLIAAAEALGDHETRSACEAILAQEENMAQWLRAHLPEITTQYLRREAMHLEEQH
ncbi:ferritin-like domain-containing protein [Beijerinckia indica]|uniref:Uncharacterized protein n=1 Tax=Beijerinckia indica subsp. indica (strain ATCC 9039 / DSM 1715 / NCIMB 8712) TaxID=395963 RepID=B2ILG4_BEII9|nr:ferritin-like domain-containing protein [Beijerinckia indica]ACB97364.1 protein of unknown function DUF892 [Beijerinckia indica subsp. indica ATCC 9039]